MIVSALVGLVMATASTMIWQTDGARRRTERSADAWTEADTALRAISDAMANIYRPTVDDTEIVFEGIDGTLNGEPSDRVRFMTVGYHTVRLGQPESDVREVEFALVQDPDDDTSSLARRLDPTYNLTDEVGGVIDRLARNVVMLDIRYFDGLDWLEEWPLEYNQLPAAVRVTLRVMVENWNPSDTRQPSTITLTRLIYPPRVPPFEPAAPSSQQNNQTQSQGATSVTVPSSSGSSTSNSSSGNRGGGRE
ncbi:MAG: hypothetical protein IT445_14060 [Phycisphaeraceae bacterium]|nr:hypothetical protein [Phycisphaeraceae bacterium]